MNRTLIQEQLGKTKTKSMHTIQMCYNQLQLLQQRFIVIKNIIVAYIKKY